VNRRPTDLTLSVITGLVFLVGWLGTAAAMHFLT
jgi:hypothetical protein